MSIVALRGSSACLDVPTRPHITPPTTVHNSTTPINTRPCHAMSHPTYRYDYEEQEA